MSTLDSTLFFQRKWDVWKQAKQFPVLVQKADYTLTFTLGRDNFGFEYGDTKSSYSGAKLNLTGATVKLVCEKMPVKPGYLDASRGEAWAPTTEIFDIDGTVTDATGGEVEFDLDTDDTDVIGRVLAQIQVTDVSGKIIIPGHVRINFVERLG